MNSNGQLNGSRNGNGGRARTKPILAFASKNKKAILIGALLIIGGLWLADWIQNQPFKSLKSWQLNALLKDNKSGPVHDRLLKEEIRRRAADNTNEALIKLMEIVGKPFAHPTPAPVASNPIVVAKEETLHPGDVRLPNGDIYTANGYIMHPDGDWNYPPPGFRVPKGHN